MIGLRNAAMGASALIGLAVVSVVGYRLGSRSRDAGVQQLSTLLAQSEQTVRLKQGLYEAKVTELSGLTSLLDSADAQNKDLLAQLSQTKSRLLSTQQVVVKWHQPIQGAVEAKQTEVTLSSVTRKRVDFHRDFGPISVTGHTLTDPPEGEVALTQTRPLRLTVSVARDPNGKWSSLVTSSEPNMDVGITLGAVDPGVVTDVRWYQRIWIDMGASAFLGDPSISLGASYRGDRYSLGASCFQSIGTHGCGISAGIRLFR